MNKRLFALGMLLAAGMAGGCGDDDPKGTGPDGGGMPGADAGEGGVIVSPDGEVPDPNNDGSVTPIPDGGLPEGGPIIGTDGGPSSPSTGVLGAAGGKLSSPDGKLELAVL